MKDFARGDLVQILSEDGWENAVYISMSWNANSVVHYVRRASGDTVFRSEGEVRWRKSE